MIDERPLWAARLYTSTKFSEKENPKKEITTVFSHKKPEILLLWQNAWQNFLAVPLEIKKKSLGTLTPCSEIDPPTHSLRSRNWLV